MCQINHEERKEHEEDRLKYRQDELATYFVSFVFLWLSVFRIENSPEHGAVDSYRTDSSSAYSRSRAPRLCSTICRPASPAAVRRLASPSQSRITSAS